MKRSHVLLAFLLFLLSNINAQVKSSGQQNTYLSYKNFDVILHDFNGFTYHSFSRYMEDGGIGLETVQYPDTSKATVVRDDSGQFILKIKVDTIRLSEKIRERILKKDIQIVPKNKVDDFNVTISYKQDLREIFDFRDDNKPEEGWDKWSKNAKRWVTTTDYFSLEDSGMQVFKIPDFNKKDFKDELKRKYGLTDTSVTIPSEYTRTATLAYENRLIWYTIRSIYLRIDRLNNGRVVERKYIQIILELVGC